MRMHFGAMMEYTRARKSKKPQRWWKTSCKRKTLAANQWDRPADITMDPMKVTCKKCLEEIGVELLHYV